MNLRFVTAAFLCATFLAPTSARAHGLFGHVHVTGWAVENMPPGELRAMFGDPEVFNALLMGATFPDTGYALGTDATRAYGEHAHWEPFVEDFIQHIRTNYGPTYDTHEERMLIAFLLGCASHGMQDELFDSLILHEAEQRDAPYGQGETDPGTDGFLVLDGHVRLFPQKWIPYADLLPLFANLGQPIDEPLIDLQVRRVLEVYVNDEFGYNTAEATAAGYAVKIPWTRDHYLDPSIPGSLRSEIAPTAAYMQAIWNRLHDRYDPSALVIHTFPNAPRRLREAESTSAASWVTLVFGMGVRDGSATGSLADANGTAVPFDLRYTRWAGNGYSRLIRFQATEDYAPGETFTATMNPGAPLIDGSTTTSAHALTFQVECATPEDARCPELPRIDDPLLEQPPKGEGCSVRATRDASPFALVFAALASIAIGRTRRRSRGASA